MLILPSGKKSRVDRIVTFNSDLEVATSGQSITFTLKDEIDCSRGQIIVAAKFPLEVADQFQTTLIWMGERRYSGPLLLFKIGTQTVSATVSQPKYRINVNTMEQAAAARWISMRLVWLTFQSIVLFLSRLMRKTGVLVVLS